MLSKQLYLFALNVLLGVEAIEARGAETEKIEFKGACDWDVNSLAKDILALSNVRRAQREINSTEMNTCLK